RQLVPLWRQRWRARFCGTSAEASARAAARAVGRLGSGRAQSVLVAGARYGERPNADPPVEPRVIVDELAGATRSERWLLRSDVRRGGSLARSPSKSAGAGGAREQRSRVGSPIDLGSRA